MAFPFSLYLVISESNCIHHSLVQVAEQAIKGGVDIIQLREKELSNSQFIEKALALKNITEKYNIPLIINDNVEVAKTVNAYGIHVGNSDMPPVKIKEVWPEASCIGYSIEYLNQLQNENTAIADYLAVSPVYSTATKIDTITEWGIEGIESIRSKTKKPLVAIGNMNADNCKSVINAGSDCIAVVSAICSAKNPEKEAAILKNNILKSKKS
ncbi:thiamine phosphate synthase [Zunongwangia sp.]|uniref:thiamine phosphate synthase n=1 Tax=Zunongwangia sp. TaxID=1965325 RepID=UPI003AA957CC